MLHPFFIFQFPDCSDDKAISVACLDLHYYVSVAMETQLKNEKNDTSSPLTLGDLKPEVDVNGNGSPEPSEKRSKWQSSLSPNLASYSYSTTLSFSYFSGNCSSRLFVFHFLGPNFVKGFQNAREKVVHVRYLFFLPPLRCILSCCIFQVLSSFYNSTCHLERDRKRFSMEFQHISTLMN